MKELQNPGDHTNWITKTAGPVAAERFRQAETTEGKREQLRQAKLDIYRIGHLLIKRLLDESKPLPQSAEELAFEEGFGSMSPEQIAIVNSMLEQIQEASELTREDYEEMQEICLLTGDDLNTEYFHALTRKSPNGPLTLNISSLGILELTLLRQQNIAQYYDEFTYLDRRELTEEQQAKYTIWGTKYPFNSLSEDEEYYTTATYNPAKLNRQTRARIPLLLIAAHEGMKETSLHEKGHHLNEMLLCAIEEARRSNDTADIYAQFSDEATSDYAIYDEITSMTTEELTPKSLARINVLLDDQILTFHQYAWQEITTDLTARGYPRNIQTVITPGAYDFFVQFYGDDIHELPSKVQAALVTAREKYYDTIIPIGHMILEVHEQLASEGNQDKIDSLFGMMRAKPIHLWAREVRRMFSDNPPIEQANHNETANAEFEAKEELKD